MCKPFLKIYTKERQKRYYDVAAKLLVTLNILVFLEKCFNTLKASHCVKSVSIRSFFWYLFSCIWTEYEVLLRKSTDQKKLRIWTLHAVSVSQYENQLTD